MSSATISASGVDTFSDVDVALQADGGFVISWEEQARGPLPISPGNAYPYAILSQGLYVERFDADGQSVTGPVLVSSESGPSFNVANRTGSIDSLPDGQTIIAYLQPPVSGPAPNQITVAMFDANLVASSSPIRISASGLNTFTDVDVAYRADGGFVLTWEGQTRGPLSDTDPDEILSEGVYVQQFASDGQAIAGPVMLSSETGPIFDTTERRTSITTLPDGEALVAYLSAPSPDANPNQIIVRRLGANLASSSQAITISASGVNTFSDVAVTAEDNGGFVVTWEGQTRGPLAISPTDIDPTAILSEGVYIQRFTADGAPVTSPVLLSSETGSVVAVTDRRLGVAAGPDGGTLVAYLAAPSSADEANQIVVDDATNVAIPCFATGTRIATPRGLVAVERLLAGDVVMTVSGGSQVIQWIGRRHIDCRRHINPERVWPIRVAPHAFGDGRPGRPLLLSPDHAIFIEDVLIPVKFLVNSSTVVQLSVDAVEYYHVELPRHDVVLADGLPTESYLETGGRAAFANSGMGVQLYPDFAADEARVRMVWQNFGYAPLLGDGEQVARARMKLEWQAAMLAGEKARASVRRPAA